MNASNDSHTGPIKTPTQVLWVSVLSFVVPVFVIIGLVAYVTSFNKPAAGADTSEQAVNARLTKVGSVEVKAAGGPARTGEEVFKGQCFACHATGAAGAPKLGDTGAWGPRLVQGLDVLVRSAMQGKNGMPAQGGGDASDEEIARAVVYMGNAAGGKFAEPAAPVVAEVQGSAAIAAPVKP